MVCTASLTGLTPGQPLTTSCYAMAIRYSRRGLIGRDHRRIRITDGHIRRLRGRHCVAEEGCLSNLAAPADAVLITGDIVYPHGRASDTGELLPFTARRNRTPRGARSYHPRSSRRINPMTSLRNTPISRITIPANLINYPISQNTPLTQSSSAAGRSLFLTTLHFAAKPQSNHIDILSTTSRSPTSRAHYTAVMSGLHTHHPLHPAYLVLHVPPFTSSVTPKTVSDRDSRHLRRNRVMSFGAGTFTTTSGHTRSVSSRRRRERTTAR
jgi:hypothetical protein